MAEGSTVASGNVELIMNLSQRPSLQVCLLFFFHLGHCLVHSPVIMGRYRVYAERAKTPTLDLFI